MPPPPVPSWWYFLNSPYVDTLPWICWKGKSSSIPVSTTLRNWPLTLILVQESWWEAPNSIPIKEENCSSIQPSSSTMGRFSKSSVNPCFPPMTFLMSTATLNPIDVSLFSNSRTGNWLLQFARTSGMNNLSKMSFLAAGFIPPIHWKSCRPLNRM